MAHGPQGTPPYSPLHCTPRARYALLHPLTTLMPPYARCPPSASCGAPPPTAPVRGSASRARCAPRTRARTHTRSLARARASHYLAAAGHATTVTTPPPPPRRRHRPQPQRRWARRPKQGRGRARVQRPPRPPQPSSPSLRRRRSRTVSAACRPVGHCRSQWGYKSRWPSIPSNLLLVAIRKYEKSKRWLQRTATLCFAAFWCKRLVRTVCIRPAVFHLSSACSSPRIRNPGGRISIGATREDSL